MQAGVWKEFTELRILQHPSFGLERLQLCDRTLEVEIEHLRLFGPEPIELRLEYPNWGLSTFIFGLQYLPSILG